MPAMLAKSANPRGTEAALNVPLLRKGRLAAKAAFHWRIVQEMEPKWR
jgi:hypothetical protein